MPLEGSGLRVQGYSFWDHADLLGVRIRGTLGDVDPLKKLPFKRAASRVQKGPL